MEKELRVLHVAVYTRYIHCNFLNMAYLLCFYQFLCGVHFQWMFQACTNQLECSLFPTAASNEHIQSKAVMLHFKMFFKGTC